MFILVKSPVQSDHIDLFLVSVRNFGLLATLLSTVAPQPATLCVQSGHDRSNCPTQLFTCANSAGFHYSFYRGCPTCLRCLQIHFTRGQAGSTPTIFFFVLPTPVLSFSLVLPFLPKMFLHLPSIFISYSFPTFIPSLFQSNSFAILTPDALIPTSPMLYPLLHTICTFHPISYRILENLRFSDLPNQLFQKLLRTFKTF